MTADRYPKRIVCLTEETTETLYLLGEQDRIVGISGFTVRPPQARKEKPKVSGFTSANYEKILKQKPDLVLGFSDLQADIMAELVKRGVDVHIFNHRSVEGILDMIQILGAMVGVQEKAAELIKGYQKKISVIQLSAAEWTKKPVIYFEEWHDPMISGIRWVSELVEIAGGVDCFHELACEPLAKNRILGDATEVIRRNPDIIIGSWCGRKFIPKQVRDRAGWDAINAVKNNQLFEIKSPNILQPGPAALTDGLDELHHICVQWVEKYG